MTEDTTFLYFAYGSNMSTARLRQRTPSAQPMGIGQLKGHRLMFHKVGRDCSAKCDIVTSAESDLVWGVLFEVALKDKPSLDRAEGLGNGYEYKKVEVMSNRETVTAGTYYATHIDPGLLPFDWYLNFVLQGATEHRLPSEYIKKIASVKAIKDPNKERSLQNISILKDHKKTTE